MRWEEMVGLKNRLQSISGGVLILLAFVASPLCNAQQVTASLSGTVEDTSAAVIPQAALTATNVSTGVPFRTISDSSGNYIFPSLAPATYSLTARKRGFRSTVISGITLMVYQKATVDVVLQVGSVTQRVAVKGTTPLVSTTNASIGTVANTQQMVDLPLNQREVGSLALLVPGTVNTTSRSLTSSSTGNGSRFNDNSYAADGGGSGSNLVLIDGVISRALNNGGFSLQPFPEMTQEFEIQNQ